MKSKKLKQIVYIFVILIISVFIINTADAKEPDRIRIGFVSGITGAIATWAYPAVLAYKYVIEQVNREGGIKSLGGAKIDLFWSDCESDAKRTVTETEKMLTLRKPHVMLGAVSSALIKGALPITLRHKVPYIGMAYSDELYEMNNPFWFGVMPKMSINAKAIASYLIKTGKEKGHPVKRAAVLCMDGSAGELSYNAFVKYFSTHGVEVVAHQLYPTGKVADFSDTISKFKALKADVVVGTVTPHESAQIVRAMKATNFNPLGYAFSCTCIDTPDFINLKKDGDFAFGCPIFSIEEIGDRIKGSVPFLKEFYKTLKTEKDRKLCTEKVVLERVLTIGPIIHALEKAGSYDPVAIRDAMANLDLKTGDRYIYWPDGVKFDKKGWNSRAKTIGGQYQNLKLKVLFPESMKVEGNEPVWPLPKWRER